MKKQLACILLLFTLIMLGSAAKTLYAQSQYRFERFDTKNGLAFEEVRSIRQDNLGFVWIQHYDGLSRFDGYDFKIYKYDPDDSLRSSLNFQINNLLKDPSGNIYAKGDPNKLFRYDPKTDGFVPIKMRIDDVVIQDQLFEPDNKTIWIATWQKGLYSVDIQTDEITNYFNHDLNPDVELLQNDVNGFKDLGSSLLLATLNGLWLFDKATKNFRRPVCNPKDSAWLYRSPFVGISSLGKGGFWLRRFAGLAKSDRSTGSFVKLDKDFSVVHKFNLPPGFAGAIGDIDDDGVLWGGAGQGLGLYRYDPSDSSFTILRDDRSDPYSLGGNTVRAVMVDKDQNIWVGTTKGVSLLRKKSLNFYNTNFRGGRLEGSMLYQENKREYLILGTINTAGFVNDIWRGEIIPGKYDQLELKKTLIPIKGYAISYFWKGHKYFWASAPGGGVFGFPINSTSGNIESGPVRALVHDPGNKNTIGYRLVTAVLEDPAGNLWVANKRTGLAWVSGALPYGEEGSVVNFKHLENDSNSIHGNTVYYLYPENEKSLWVITTTGVDLFHHDDGKGTGHFEHVFKDRELPNIIFKTSDGTLFLGTSMGLYEARRDNNTKRLKFSPLWIKAAVTAIQEDKLGRLWLYSSNGPVCYNRKERTAVEFTSLDGIEHTRAVNAGCMHCTKEGMIVMIDPEGISMFDPLDFQATTKEIHPVLTNLEINNNRMIGKGATGDDNYLITSDITMLNELVIDYKHNNFSVEFSSMQMTAPEKNLYRHKLEGYDKDWIETDYKNRTATYTNLPAGDYTFKVKARSHHGIWSDQEKILSVIVLPPPWKTWWAYTGYWLLVAGMLVAARRIIVQRERLKSNLKLEQVEREKEHLELEKAQEVDKMKSAFFANISHEFRTPLTLIKGPVHDLMEKYASDSKTQERLKLVQRNSDLLLKLINQLLDLAKLESGSLKVEKSEGDLNSFINAVTSSFSSFASQKNIEIRIDLPSTRYQVLFDKDKLETILINLINNAIKFTPPGGNISVLAKFEASPPTPLQGRGGQFSLSSGEVPIAIGRGEALTLFVRDTGIGISLDQQTKIFERFHQVSEAHKEVGTGIGLALVKELVALMRGTITVESKPGEGSEFKVVLPIEMVRVITEVESRAEVSAQQSISEPRGQMSNVEYRISNVEVGTGKPHVLVVEDNSDLRAFIIDSLGNEFHFLEAGDGKQGLEIATREVPDLIISDVMMPEMDGITMAGKVKTDIRTSHIPLILLTAKSTEESKLSGLESGADDYLTKPFNKNELLLKVRNGVNRQLKLRERLRAELMSTAPKVEVMSEDEKFLNTVKEKILERLSDEQLSVESLADDIGMSRVQLYRKVSGLTGISVNELIRKLRLQRAAQLLQQNWGPVSQVAYEVGFSNLSYFSKVFKEEFGVLPSEYSETLT